MADLRKRTINEESSQQQVKTEIKSADSVESEDEPIPDEAHVEDLVKELPQASDKTADVLDSALSSLPSRWRNWVVRGIFTWLMIFAFFFLIWLGPLALIFTTMVVQVKCFQEIISIGYAVYRIHGLPWFRSLSWYFLITSNYFLYGERIVQQFGILLNRVDFLRPLVTYHRFISFSLYIIGFVWFVLSLVKKYYMKQFSLFAWTHVTLLIVVTQSYFIMENLFEGLIWFIVPVSMIICNDVMAYMCGFFFGKTPLIKLSPKKTWEGFIGGGIATVIFGMLDMSAVTALLLIDPVEPVSKCSHVLSDPVGQVCKAAAALFFIFPVVIISHMMCQVKYFVCPIASDETLQRMSMDCTPSPLFQLTEYNLPGPIQMICSLLHIPGTVTMYPFALHSLSLSLFSSVIGPFGGFFASGFKRAFKIKDFGDIIPGHGGIMDRFDCQFLMATFVNVYISSFIRAPDPQKLVQQVLLLKTEEQLYVFNSLQEALLAEGIL